MGNLKELAETRFFLGTKKGFYALVIITAFMLLNNILATTLFAQAIQATAAGAGAGPAVVDVGSGLNYGPKTTLKPMPLAQDEQPTFQGFRTRVKALPTISELAIAPSSSDLVQDLVNNIIPTGVPWYSDEAGGVTFDDPIYAQQTWGPYEETIQLSGEDEQRWSTIVNSFTCDYCCGSPQQPTIITRCGCAHAKAARGMAKWFIQNHGDEFSDEEIYGEMARWYALWYPGPTVKRLAEEITGTLS